MQTSAIYKNTLALYKSYVASHATFNALSAIQSYMVNNKQRQALKNLSVFGKFLRRLSQSASIKTINIEDEIDLLKHYFSIEKVRFEDRLNIIFEVQEDMEKIEIPGLVLLAFAEEQLLKFSKSEQNMISGNTISFYLKNENNCIKFKSEFAEEITLSKDIKYSAEQQNRYNLLIERLTLFETEITYKINKDSLELTPIKGLLPNK